MELLPTGIDGLPVQVVLDDEEAEVFRSAVGAWMQEQIRNGCDPDLLPEFYYAATSPDAENHDFLCPTHDSVALFFETFHANTAQAILALPEQEVVKRHRQGIVARDIAKKMRVAAANVNLSDNLPLEVSGEIEVSFEALLAERSSEDSQ